jgi:hypothetical protein
MGVALADIVEHSLQRLANALAGVIGWEATLVIMLPVVLMLRPLMALSRTAQRSWLLRGVCLAVVAFGIAAGPSVGPRAGLVLLPIYILGWACALDAFRTLQAGEGARRRLARVGRRILGQLMPLRAELTADRRN